MDEIKTLATYDGDGNENRILYPKQDLKSLNPLNSNQKEVRDMSNRKTLESYKYDRRSYRLSYDAEAGAYELESRQIPSSGKVQLERINPHPIRSSLQVQHPSFNWHHYLVNHALTHSVVSRDKLANILMIYGLEMTRNQRIGATFVVDASPSEIKPKLTRFGVQHHELQVMATPCENGAKSQVFLAKPNPLSSLIPKPELRAAFEYVTLNEAPQYTKTIEKMTDYLNELADQTPLQLLYWDTLIEGEVEDCSFTPLTVVLNSNDPEEAEEMECASLLADLCQGIPLESIVPWFGQS